MSGVWDGDPASGLPSGLAEATLMSAIPDGPGRSMGVAGADQAPATDAPPS